MRLLVALVISCWGMLLAGCGDDIQYSAPPEKTAESRPDPHQKLPTGHPPLGAPQTPAPAPGATGHGGDPFADPADAGKPVSTGPAETVDRNRVYYSGRIELDTSLALPPTYSVFVNAGHPPKGNPPVLSRRYAGEPKFPLAFELTGADLAFGDTKVDAPMMLYVIFSEKGYVLAKEGVYFKTPPEGPVPLDAKDVKLVLKKP